MPNRRHFYHYKCPECSDTWTFWTRRVNGVAKECSNCNIDVAPRVKSREPELDENRRYFGHFKCSDCNRTWMSANSWVGFGQQCEACEINVMPHTLNRLRRNITGGNLNKAHPSGLCGKCESIGKNCRKMHD